MARLPNVDLKTYTGAEIAAAYAAGTKTDGVTVQGMGKVRVFLKVVTHAASTLTLMTIKAQHAYEDVSASYIDSPSYKDDAGLTREVEHAYTVAAGGTYWFSFVVDAEAMPFLRFDMKANAAGHASDVATLYARG